MILNNYISVAEFQQFNSDIDFTAVGADVVTISGMIQRASAQVDNYLQYSLGLETIVGETAETAVTAEGNLMIWPAKFPVINVSAITLILGQVSYALTIADNDGTPRYNIPWRARYILFPYQYVVLTGTLMIRNFMQIRELTMFTQLTYTAGFATIPPDIKDAVNLLTRNIFNRGVNPADVSYQMQGGIRVDFRNVDSETGMTSLEKRAYSILASYRRLWN